MQPQSPVVEAIAPRAGGRRRELDALVVRWTVHIVEARLRDATAVLDADLADTTGRVEAERNATSA
jgi:hypothetical protein